ncbi:MAG: hypothetical protein FWF52_00745 [Candidatus Azobacteroides sp.]|nr:hypothetical protein [Candidatus Azobacteroides sp.]
MIHYFNPGHETAVLYASKHYQPPANQVKMQQELAFLPAWYARSGDFVWMEDDGKEKLNEIESVFSSGTQAVSPKDLVDKRADLFAQRVDLWGISPQSIELFEKLNKAYDLHWQIPEWKPEYAALGNRFFAHGILSFLISTYPEIEEEILPQLFSNIDEIEHYLVLCQKQQLVKSPYSSSGRGLVWLPPGKLSRSEKQIISGMLKKQSCVSIENALDKQFDFSMHFENDDERTVRFIGYSIFQTHTKGAYEKSFLSAQDELEKRIATFIEVKLLNSIQKAFVEIIGEKYAPFYKGNIGVDMMIYQSGNRYRLHPCIEINMRKSMGYLAIRLQENYLHLSFRGELRVNYYSLVGEALKKHNELKMQYPLTMEEKRIRSGYLSLCPVTETTHYHAYLIG